MILHRYWIIFDNIPASLPTVLKLGCGVTARNRQEAIDLVQARIFGANAMPGIVSMVEDIDISTLDANHVRPNMGNFFQPGIWFPLDYL